MCQFFSNQFFDDIKKQLGMENSEKNKGMKKIEMKMFSNKN